MANRQDRWRHMAASGGIVKTGRILICREIADIIAIRRQRPCCGGKPSPYGAR
jgi:hypothetical protein